MASQCAASSKNFANLNEKGPAAMRALFCWMGLCDRIMRLRGSWQYRHPELVSGSYFSTSKIKTLKQVQGDGICKNVIKTSQTQRPGSRALDRSIRHRPLALCLAFARIQLQPLALPFHGQAWPPLFRVLALVLMVPPLLRVRTWLLALLACGRALRVRALRVHPMEPRSCQDVRSWCQSAFRCFQWLLHRPW
jgi:hypothetical protein